MLWNYDTFGTFIVATSFEGSVTPGIAQKFTYTLDTGKTPTSIYTPDSVAVFDISDISHRNTFSKIIRIKTYSPSKNGLNKIIEMSKLK